MFQRLQRAISACAQGDALQHFRATAKREHLLPLERDSDRTLKFQASHHREKHLILRPEPGAESSPDKRRENAHIIVRQSEDSAQIALIVPRSLGFVVNRKLSTVPHDCGSEGFHGVVMFWRAGEFRFQMHWSASKSRAEVAA